MSGMGHNGGPSMEPGFGFRRHAWGRARKALLPTLPIEIVRVRVRRAAELGLDYRTYATVRATTGRDITAFLFSSNALRMVRPGEPPQHAERVAASAAGRLMALQPPLGDEAAGILADAGIPFDALAPAPRLSHSDRETRERLAALHAGIPRDAVLVIGETALERSWVASARLAGWLPAERWVAGP